MDIGSVTNQHLKELRADQKRLEFIMPIIGLTNAPDSDERTIKLKGAMMLGNTGRETIDAAMDEC